MEDERFNQELDELFRLFQRLMEKSDMEHIPGVNKFMLQQFSMFFSNYENMKGDIARQLKGQFGDSVKEMIHQLVMQLREELGEDELLHQEITGKVHITPPPENTNQLTLEQLDEMLKNPNLTEDELNELLDIRSKLANNT